MFLSSSTRLIVVNFLSSSAFALGTGGAGACCGEFVKSLPQDQQVPAIELQKQFYLKSEDELDRLTFDETQTCKIIECGILEPKNVVKLAEFVKENKRFTSSNNRLDNQLWIALGAMFISILSLMVAFLNFRKPK